MKLLQTLQTLTRCACVVSIVTCAFSFEIGRYHFEAAPDMEAASRAWGQQELITTGITLSLTLCLLGVVDKTPACSPRVCAFFSFVIAASSCFTLPNLLTSGLMLMCALGWVHVIAFKHQQMDFGMMMLEEKPLAPAALPPPSRTVAALRAPFGLFGIILVFSLVMFTLRFIELGDAMPLSLRLVKASAAAFQACMATYALPSLARVLPRVIQHFVWMPKLLRTKDERLQERIVSLGAAWTFLHIIFHLASFVLDCRSDLYCLTQLTSPLAWLTGFLLFWLTILVLTVSSSPDFIRYYYTVQRFGHVLLLAMFFAHIPFTNPWLVGAAVLILLDLCLQWLQIFPAKLATATTRGGITHLCITKPRAWKHSASVVEGMINLQILQIGTAFKPFYVFRLPGKEEEIHCLIKAHAGGWTDDLQTSVARNKRVHAGTRVYLDGPHRTLSSKRTTSSFSSLLLLASGVGITVPLSILGNLDAKQTTYLHLEWSFRARDVGAFEKVLGHLFAWKASELPQLTCTINVSACNDEKDENLASLQRAVAANNGPASVSIHQGRIPFEHVLNTCAGAQREGQVVGVFGCASREYCHTAQTCLDKYHHRIATTTTRFQNHLESHAW